MPLNRAAALVRGQAARLRESRGIREIGQPAVPAGDQQFVSLDEGRLLIVRLLLRAAGPVCPGGHRARVAVRPRCRLGDGENRAAILAYHRTSPRHSAACPHAVPSTAVRRAHARLLAVGHAEEHDYLVTESVATIPFEEAFAKASVSLRARLLQRAGAMVRQLHEAGYHLPAWETWPCRLGVVPSTGVLFLAKVEPLPRDNVPWQERALENLTDRRFAYHGPNNCGFCTVICEAVVGSGCPCL